jgi:hypothetical protein
MKKGFLLALLLLSPMAYADWSYGASIDKMTDKQSPWANIESVNSLSLDFPYAGKNHGQILICQTPKGALNVLVSVQKGQILCSQFTSCNISVRFDDDKPVRFSGVEAADNSSNNVFLEPEPKFVASAKKAKRILISFTMYHAGEQVLEFRSAQPLEWAPNGPAKTPAKK